MRPGSRSSARNVATCSPSVAAAHGSCVSDRMNTPNASSAPASSRSLSRRRSDGSRRRISSFRTVTTIAVRGAPTPTPGSSPGQGLPRFAGAGWRGGENTARTGSRQQTRIRKPINPFARHRPVHGAVPRKAASITSFGNVQPPGTSTRSNSRPRPVAASSTISTTRVRRAAIRVRSRKFGCGRESRCEVQAKCRSR